VIDCPLSRSFGRGRPARAFLRSSTATLVLSLAVFAIHGRAAGQAADAVASLAPSAAEVKVGKGGLRLDQTRELACHNCYDGKLPYRFADALKRTRTRSVEIDINDDYRRHRGARPGAWYVRHKGRGNDSNCARSGNDGDLRTCLEVVRSWLEQTPPVGPLLVFLDKKQGWDDERSPRDLDSLILQVIPRERIYTPADLRGTAHATLQDAAADSAWLRVDSVRNRVTFVLTGPNGRLHHYVDARRDTAVAFVAPDVKRVREVDGRPGGFDEVTTPYLVFYNFRSTRARTYAIAKRARDRNRITRVWFPLKLRGTEGQNTCKLLRVGVNRVARYQLFDMPGDECLTGRPGKRRKGDPMQQD
jgi:hypothetical protein